jgi:hypothetical protein
MGYSIGGVEVTEEYWRAHNAAASGSQQIGSQFWMNSGYTGPEPDLATKQAFSTAEYANTWIGDYSKKLVDAGVPVSDSVAAIAKTAIPPSQQISDLWQAVPQIAPSGALADRIAEAGGYTKWATNMGVVTAQTNTVNDPNATLAPPSPVSGAGAGTLDVMQAEIGGLGAAISKLAGTGSGTSASGSDTTESPSLLSQLGIIPLVIIGGLFVGLIWLATRGHSRGIPA